MPALLRTSDHPAADRGELWRFVMGQFFLPHEMTFDGSAGFNGLLRARAIGPMKVADATAGAHHVARTTRLCATSETDYYKVGMPLRGYCLVTQDGREAPLLPGDISVYDTSRPYTLTFNDTCQMALVMFPRRFLRLSPDEMHGVTASRISGRHGTGTLASPLLRNLVLHIDEFSEHQSMQIADNVFDLLATVFCERLGKSATPVVGTTQTLLLRIKVFIENHLDDAELTPDAVAAAVHISTG
ncbi:MAG: cupin domain-containing protein, partial [Trebonia sp.]